MDLFTLSAKITADTSDFDKKVEQAEQQGKQLCDLSGDFVGLAGAIGDALPNIASKLRDYADRAGEAGDAIDKGAQKLGFSREAYQEWGYVLQQNGGNIDTFGSAIKRMNTQVEKGSDVFEELGLSVEELQNMTPEQAFEAITTAMQGMPEGADKARAAVEIFGQKGQELLPTLNQTAEATDALKNRAHELGLVMSDEEVTAATAYGDAMSDLHKTLDMTVMKIGLAVIPTLKTWAEKGAEFAGKLINAYNENGLAGVLDVLKESYAGLVSSMKESDSKPIQVLGAALEFVGNGVQWLLDHKEIAIAAVTGIIGAFVATKILGVFAALGSVNGVLALIGAAAAVIIANWDGIVGFFQDVWSGISGAFTSAWNTISGIVNNVVAAVQSAYNAVAGFLGLGGGNKTGKTVTPAAIDEAGLRAQLNNMTNEQAAAFLDAQGLVYNSASDTFGFKHQAKGNWYVPYDDYLSSLHRGEMVLTASQARQYREGNSGFDMAALSSAIVDAVKQGLQDATVRSFLNGRELTDAIAQIMGEDLTARRFA